MDCFRGRMSAVIAANHSVDSLLLFCCSYYLLRFAASLFFYDLTHVLDGDVPSKSSFHGRSASGWLLFPEVDVSVRYGLSSVCDFLHALPFLAGLAKQNSKSVPDTRYKPNI